MARVGRQPHWRRALHGLARARFDSHEQERGAPFWQTCTLRSVGLAATVLVALFAHWFAVAGALSSSRGFEFTDEALYLLAAREIGGTSHWGFPWGWHTAPFFALVGWDIADFRTIGAYILSLVGGVLGVTVYRSLFSESGLMAVSRRHYGLYSSVFGFAGVISTLFYYAAFVRTPSYNWVNLLGLLIALIGGIGLIRTQTARSALMDAWLLFVVSFGIIFAAPGKPSSSVFLLITLLVLWTFTKGIKQALLWGISAVALSAANIAALIVSGLWPANFLIHYWNPIGAPGLTESSNLPGALIELVRLPARIVSAMGGQGTIPVGLLFAALLAWSISFFAIRFREVWRFVSMLLMLCSSFWVFVGEEWFVYKNFSPDRWVSADITITWLILLAGAVISFFTTIAQSPPRGGLLYSPKQSALIATALTFMPFIFGFGSGHGLLRQASLAAIGFVIAVLVLLVAGTTGIVTRWAIASVGAFALFVVSVLWLDSLKAPYRMLPISAQTTAVEIGVDRVSSLFVDEGTKKRVEDFRKIAASGKLAAGDPIISLVDGWNADLAVILEAEAPPGLMVTLFGYEGSVALGKWKLREVDSEFDWSASWVVTSDPTTIAPARFAEIRTLLDVVERKSGHVFPDGYRLEGSVGAIQFYSPVSPRPEK